MTTVETTLQPRERKTERWSLSLSNPAPSILFSRITGHIDIPCVKIYWDFFERVAMSRTPVETFHDWYDLKAYDPDVRTQYVEWSRAHRQHFRNVHILVRSRLLAMGVSVANLALGYITAYSDRRRFERVRDEALRAALGK